MRCIGTAVHLLPAFLEGFLVMMVVCGNGGCQEQAPTATANYLVCSLLLDLYKRYPGAREQPKKWEIELFWQYDFPLAGWYPKRSVDGWEFILVPVVCVPPKSDASSTSTCVALVGWMGMAS